jgi:PAT family beta-lactamase induction signal transducer AmpG
MNLFKHFKNPSFVALVLLGFSAGLPFLLVGGTLSAWLDDARVDIKVIGFFAWIGLVRTFKFLLAPLVQSLTFGSLGLRRGWILFGQLGVATCLMLLSNSDPSQQLLQVAALCVGMTTFSVIQDIAIDAWLLERSTPETAGVLAAGYTLGYRLALLTAGAGALILADHLPWSSVYGLMSGLMLLGMFTTLCLQEPHVRRQPPVNPGLYQAVVEPFVEFFARLGKPALLILLFITCFKLSDQLIGVLANPFYKSLGFSKTEIAAISKVYGVLCSLGGAFVGGSLVAWLGLRWSLIFAAIGVAASNLSYTWMSGMGHQVWALTTLISLENFASGFAGVVFIAYLSSLVSRDHTATQYALMTALMSVPGVLLSGYSGVWVKQLGYGDFFAFTALAGVPSVLLAWWVTRPVAAKSP